MPQTFNAYQSRSWKLASYPHIGNNLLYPALGLAGEAGETVDKIKKFWRNNGITSGEQLTPEQKTSLLLEVGDVLWYCAALATELDTPLDDIAEMNISKLEDRHERGVIKGEGDVR